MRIHSKNQPVGIVDGGTAVAHAFSPEGTKAGVLLRPNMNFSAAELTAPTR